MTVNEKEDWYKVPAGIAESCIIEEMQRISTLVDDYRKTINRLEGQLLLLRQIHERQHMIKLEYAKGHMDNDSE